MENVSLQIKSVGFSIVVKSKGYDLLLQHSDKFFVMKKGTKLYSIAKMKCPKCQEGDFFVSHPYNLKKAGDIYPKCINCGLKYEKEPGFYYGAMYVSYAICVAIFVFFWVSFNLFFENVRLGLQIGIIITAFLITAPYVYALSKIIWANLFISFDPKEKKEV